jgi:VWFA-related protein
VNVAAIATADKESVQMPVGVYTNLVTMRNVPVPPTILLMDGLNSDLARQMQVHRQMVKLLASIPQDIPVAVFLLDRNLHLLQNFSTDRSLLRTAVDRTLSVGVQELNPTDVRADPDALSAMVQDNPPPPPPTAGAGGTTVAAELQQTRNSAVSEQVLQLQRFEREASTTLVTIRVQITLDAFRSIARHVAGYPGRKNLLWVSSSFPLTIFPDADFKFAGMGEFQNKFTTLANALSDARIAVYPMDPAGLEAQTFYDASARPTAGNVAIGTQTSSTLMREEDVRSSNRLAMSQMAEQTGGRICVNNNDLADCVRKAVNDGSNYYELAYYPDAANWNGEFHRIIVKTRKGGVHLSFREGYYAHPAPAAQADDTNRVQTELQEAACRDLLTSTAILLMAESIPADAPNQVKYFLAMDPRFLSFVPMADGRRLSIIVAACSLNKDGTPLQYLQQPADMNLTDQQYGALMAQHGFTRTLTFTPAPGTARVRLLVRDNDSGKTGSVDIPYRSVPVADAAQPAPTLRNTADPPTPR